MVRHQTLRNCSCTIPARASGGQCCDQRHLELLHDSLHSCTLELLVSKSQIPCDKQRKPPASISRCSGISINPLAIFSSQAGGSCLIMCSIFAKQAVQGFWIWPYHVPHPCLPCILSVPSLSSIFIVGVLCDTRCGKVDVKVGGQIICNHCHDFTQSILHLGFICCSQSHT